MAPSFKQGSADLQSSFWLEIDPKQVERVTERVGAERCAGRDAETERYMGLPLAQRKGKPEGVEAPAVAVVGVDGGRLQVRTGFKGGAAAQEPEEEALPDEEGRKGKHWREDKIGVLMAMASPEHAEDPCPEVPAALMDPARIAKLARELKARKSASADAGADGAAPAAPARAGRASRASRASPRRRTRFRSGSRPRWSPRIWRRRAGRGRSSGR